MVPDGPDELNDISSDLLGLNYVHRWTVIQTLRPQSVAEHCYNVAVIASELYMRLQGTAGDNNMLAQVLMWSMVHDAPEVLTGDIDGKFKRENPEMRAEIIRAEVGHFPWFKNYAEHVEPEVVALVKLADKMEAIAFIKRNGVGPRADTVMYDLECTLFEQQIPAVAKVIGAEADYLELIVKRVMRHSLGEYNSIQHRMDRDKAEAAKIPESGHGTESAP